MTRRRQNISRLLRRKSILLLNLAILAFIIYGFVGEYGRNRQMQVEIDRLAAQAAEVEQRNVELEQLSKRFAASEIFERDARLKLNLQKPGEEVVVIQGEMGVIEEGGAEEAEDAGSVRVSNIKKWWNYIFDKSDNNNEDKL